MPVGRMSWSTGTFVGPAGARCVARDARQHETATSASLRIAMTAPSVTTPPEIQLLDLEKRFREVRAVDGVSLEVGAGEFFSLLGPSGCGKTTTLRMIGGFELPTGGTILLRGRDVTADPPDKRPVNMVFQNYALFPHLDVGDNVAFGLKRKGVAKDETDATGRRGARARPPDRLRTPQAEPAVGRPAAAGRPRPGAGQPAQRAAPRRAARRPRPQAAAPAPGRAQAHPGGGRDHLRVRDPRPGGGAHDERPDRGDARGQGRAARDAGGALRAPGDPVRRRLHRLDQPAARTDRGRRQGPPRIGRGRPRRARRHAPTAARSRSASAPRRSRSSRPAPRAPSRRRSNRPPISGPPSPTNFARRADSP